MFAGRTISSLEFYLMSSQCSTTTTSEFMHMDDTKDVFFKIVVPNYNNMAYIKRCLDSILQ